MCNFKQKIYSLYFFTFLFFASNKIESVVKEEQAQEISAEDFYQQISYDKSQMVNDKNINDKQPVITYEPADSELIVEDLSTEEEAPVPPKKKLVSSASIEKTIKKKMRPDPYSERTDQEEAYLEEQAALFKEMERLQKDNEYLRQRKEALENDPHNKLVEGTVLSINDFAVVLTFSTIAFVALCAAFGWYIHRINLKENVDSYLLSADASLERMERLIINLLKVYKKENDDISSTSMVLTPVKEMSNLIDSFRESRKKISKSDRDVKYSSLDSLQRGLSLIIKKSIDVEKRSLGGSGGLFGASPNSEKLSVLLDMEKEASTFALPVGQTATRSELIDAQTKRLNYNVPSDILKKKYEDRVAKVISQPTPTIKGPQRVRIVRPPVLTDDEGSVSDGDVEDFVDDDDYEDDDSRSHRTAGSTRSWTVEQRRFRGRNSAPVRLR